MLGSPANNTSGETNGAADTTGEEVENVTVHEVEIRTVVTETFSSDDDNSQRGTSINGENPEKKKRKRQL